MITVVCFCAAAAAGALARAEAGRRWNRSPGLPLGTVAVNVLGSFLLGLLATTAPPVLTVIGVGGLGTLTTFSSFARDAVATAEQRSIWSAAVYIMLSCSLGIAGAALGIMISGE